MSFHITSKDASFRARTGIIHTPHGDIETPAYVIVGTHAEVKTLRPEELARTKTQVVIANTYHLWQRLGEEGLKTYKGVHAELGWNSPVMTDSGGFQVFSLGARREHGVGKVGFEAEPQKQKNNVRITDEGVYFTTDKGEQFLGPKESMRIQRQLGADIIFAFDECTSPLHDYEYTKKSMRRTHRWEKQCLEVQPLNTDRQLLYGIVQGGEFRDLREESARYVGGLPFDGFAVGGSLGRSRSHAFEILDWTIPLLPEEKPRHFLGIGKIEDIFDGVEAGIDTFDCVIPTREARHGRLWVKGGYFDIIKSVNKNNSSPIEADCVCETCQTLKRGDLHERFKAKEPTAARYATIHNVFFFNTLMEEIRKAIKEGTFQKLRQQYV